MKSRTAATNAGDDRASVVFVSPHYDDAVLSCGKAIAALPGSCVITAFSSGPPRTDSISAWDRECGFVPGDDVAAIRLREDDDALSLLNAHGSALGFVSAQYRASTRSGQRGLNRVRYRFPGRGKRASRLQRAIARKLAEALQGVGVTICVVPLGVSHPDHVLTASSALSLVLAFPTCRWVAYADLPYSAERAEALHDARMRVASAGFSLEPTILTDHLDTMLKQQAIERYGSQMQGLGERIAIVLSSPERYYDLVPIGPHTVAE